MGSECSLCPRAPAGHLRTQKVLYLPFGSRNEEGGTGGLDTCVKSQNYRKTDRLQGGATEDQGGLLPQVAARKNRIETE